MNTKQLSINILLVFIFIILIIALFYSMAFKENTIFHGPREIDENGKPNIKIALTFDDGPSDFTLDILEILNKKNTTATFFILGMNAEKHLDIVKLVNDEGHEIGIHTYYHPFLLLASRKTIYDELHDSKELLNKLNISTTLFRPPWGVPSLITKHTFLTAEELGLKTVDWDVTSYDWKYDPERIIKKVITNTRPGSIILLHDGGGESRENTVKALPVIIDKLREKGFEFVGVGELIDH